MGHNYRGCCHQQLGQHARAAEAHQARPDLQLTLTRTRTLARTLALALTLSRRTWTCSSVRVGASATSTYPYPSLLTRTLTRPRTLPLPLPLPLPLILPRYIGHLNLGLAQAAQGDHRAAAESQQLALRFAVRPTPHPSPLGAIP